MTGLERDYLHQLTRIADALEKQNALNEKALESLNAPAEEESDDEQPDLSELLKKLSKFK
jgi:hypothetical protein